MGLAPGDFRFKLNYQMKGEYKLEKKTSGGDAITYAEPTGYRIYGGYRLGDFTGAGLFYETVEYENEVGGGND